MISASGQRVLIIIATTYSDQLVHAIVIRSYIFIPDRPRNLPTVTLRAGKVDVGVPQ
jgi:hypothetical protein